jgi:acyl-CoA dehydrogenase
LPRAAATSSRRACSRWRRRRRSTRSGQRGARDRLALAKFAVPSLALAVIDRAIQAHGGAGVSQDFLLAYAYASTRTLRIADGPDEVHARTVSLFELKRRAKL